MTDTGTQNVRERWLKQIRPSSPDSVAVAKTPAGKRTDGGKHYQHALRAYLKPDPHRTSPADEKLVSACFLPALALLLLYPFALRTTFERAICGLPSRACSTAAALVCSTTFERAICVLLPRACSATAVCTRLLYYCCTYHTCPTFSPPSRNQVHT